MKTASFCFLLLFASAATGCKESASRGDDTTPPVDTRDPYVAALDQLTCAVGQTAEYDGAAWACADDDDTDTLAGLACTTGQVAKWGGGAWACADDIDTDTSLTPDQAFAAVLERDLDQAGLNATTLQGQSPAAFAAADHQHPLARTLAVGPVGAETANGAALQAAVAEAGALATSLGGWVLVQVEPGVYRMPAGGALLIPHRVHVRGAGRGVTTISSTDWYYTVSMPLSAEAKLSSLSVTIERSGSAINLGDYLCTMALFDVEAHAHADPGYVYGVALYGSATRMTIEASTISASAAAGADNDEAHALSVGGGATVVVKDSSLTATMSNGSGHDGVDVLGLHLASFGNVTLSNTNVQASAVGTVAESAAILQADGTLSFSHGTVAGDVVVNGGLAHVLFSHLSGYFVRAGGTSMCRSVLSGPLGSDVWLDPACVD